VVHIIFYKETNKHKKISFLYLFLNPDKENSLNYKMSKTIISFDIGIKNLAYCIFTVAPDSLTIRDWNVINLLDQHATTTQVPLCNCQKAKSGVCGKKAAYVFDDKYFCNVHSKNSGKLLPSKACSMPTIKKLKVDDLFQFCANHFITVGPQDKKTVVLEKVQTHFEKNTLKLIPKVKKTNANQLHLVDIGKRIKINFDEKFNPYINEVTHVILENQISPIAGRMNTIQGMVAQYFIMKTESSNLCIDFISSAGKLKGLAINEPTNYKTHKKDGIHFCTQFLEANPLIKERKSILEASAKKDDLADCFLQGIYYFKKQNIINYSEDLKIKIV
jgi:hypothetical protein